MKTAFTLIFVICDILFSITIATAFVVPSVRVLGNQTDPTAQLPPNRDGGSVGIISGKIVWLYSDTEYRKNGSLVGFYGNTGAIGQPDNPLVVVGPAKEAIPYTPEEDAFNKNHSYSPRYVLDKSIKIYYYEIESFLF